MRIGGSVENTASQALSAMSDRVADLTPLMTLMGRHMMPSIRTNFAEGGRPPWAQAKFEVESVEETGFRKTVRGKLGGRASRRQGRTRMGGLLVLTGDLRNHIGFTPEAADLVLWARPENDVVKAPVHQYGTTIAGRNRNVTIPARPFVVIQPEDLQWFRDSCDGWIRVGALQS